MLGTDEYPNLERRFYGIFQSSALESIVLPSTLKKIEYGAFQDCQNLVCIKFPNKLEYIGD